MREEREGGGCVRHPVLPSCQLLSLCPGRNNPGFKKVEHKKSDRWRKTGGQEITVAGFSKKGTLSDSKKFFVQKFSCPI